MHGPTPTGAPLEKPSLRSPASKNRRGNQEKMQHAHSPDVLTRAPEIGSPARLSGIGGRGGRTTYSVQVLDSSTRPHSLRCG